jgi:glucose-6-phosphate dehydrogenase assembly protein OpcA
MIVELQNTTTSKVSKALVRLREQGGAVALGRVLTLIIETDEENLEHSIATANEASREHPCRILVLSSTSTSYSAQPKLDAQIRVGGDAGASEVIVLKPYGDAGSDLELLATGLLLPDAPVVAWWPGRSPTDVSVSPIGRIATRRITDSAAQAEPIAFLKALSETYNPGDSDFAWTRLTLWRAQLAAILDQPPFEPITRVRVSGSEHSPSTYLLCAWLGLKLKAPVEISHVSLPGVEAGIFSVFLERETGSIELKRTPSGTATLSVSGQTEREISLPRRSDRDCLTEDLRRLDPDVLFGKVLKWLDQL